MNRIALSLLLFFFRFSFYFYMVFFLLSREQVRQDARDDTSRGWISKMGGDLKIGRLSVRKRASMSNNSWSRKALCIVCEVYGRIYRALVTALC